jgi:molybdate transport system regulatory protein
MAKPTLLTTQLHQALGHGASDKRLDILRRIGEVGSISRAARDAGVSYKAAWQAVETLNNLAGKPLLEKVVGGSGGGGARLTDAGRQLLSASERLQAARLSVVAQLDQNTLDARGVGALALRTSMRNTLPCTVARVQTVAGAVNVRLQLDDGQTLVSRITRESAQLLALHKGLPVLALCKATAVNVGAAGSAATTPNTNRLAGRVARLPPAARAGEVSLQLTPDLHLVGFAAQGHGLRKGDAAEATLDFAAVVIVLPG